MHLFGISGFLITLHAVHICGIKIGGLFNNTVDADTVNIQEFVFKHAIDSANEQLKDAGISFEAEVKHYEFHKNSLVAEKSVCSLMSNGIAGIFGPQFGDSHHIVQAICDAKEIPHIQTRWDLKQNVGSCSVNLYPYPTVLSEAFIAVVRDWQWNEYIILYENTESLMRINLLLKPDYNESVTVKLINIVPDESSYRNLLREIKESKISNIILDCSIEILPEILKQAQQVGLMGSQHSFLITNLNFQTLDLEPYQYSGTNITGFRLFNPSNIQDNMLADLSKLDKVQLNSHVPLQTLPVEAALMYDAVTLFTKAAQAILDEKEKQDINPIPCESAKAWQHGYSIINYMKLTVIEGLTGIVKFDNQGFRTQFDVHILELGEKGLFNVGKWNSLKGIEKYDRKQKETDESSRSNSLKNMTLNVIISLTAPYGMRKKSYQNLNGNDQYEGFCVDLIKELSLENHNFSINFIISKDGKSGSPNRLENKTVIWDGMIGSILKGEADLACADLTINREREEVLDITSPFMDLGIAILYKKPKSESPGFFSFLSPFKAEVWILVVTAYVTVSLLFFVMARISPYEWRNPFPCIQDPEELENQFTLSNSFWFTMGALMQQGSDIAPVSVSTRTAAGVWWFFTLIMVSCYTANLAAFLTTENPSEDFSNIDELARQTEIKYGAKRGGTTLTFFNESGKKLHKSMFNDMMAHADEVLTDSSQEGVKRAAKQKYAFLMESSQIEYETERECSLTQIGKPIDSKGYGIAMRKGSWYLGILSQSILKMQEGGKLSDLKRKWWNEKYAGSCPKAEPNDAETLGLSNLGGVFLVLAGGVVVAIIIAILEKLLYVWSISKEENVLMKERLKRELQFFFRCRGTTKPAVESNENGSNNNGIISY